METTNTDRHPMDLLTATERAHVLEQLERLSKDDREELAATGMTIVWLVKAALHTIAWRGRE